MFHTVVQRGFLRSGENVIYIFLDNLLLFPTVYEFAKSVNNIINLNSHNTVQNTTDGDRQNNI